MATPDILYPYTTPAAYTFTLATAERIRDELIARALPAMSRANSLSSSARQTTHTANPW